MKQLCAMIVLLSVFLSLPVFAELVIEVAVPDENNKKENGENKVTPIKDIKPDVVHFKNNDKMHGTMISVISDKGLLWKSQEALSDITFKTENINHIIRGNINYSANKGDAAILLTNDDMLAGKLIKIDEKELILKTAFAGELKINRNMVQSVFPGSDAGNINYRGPNNMEEWTLPPNSNSNSSVNVKNGELVIQGNTAVGRDMKLSDLSKIEFEMDAMGNSQFQIQLYGNKVDRYPRNGYVVYISSGYIYMQRYANGRADNLGNFRARTFQQGKGKVTILTNKKKKSITLLINNDISKTWTDSMWASEGGFVNFINQSNGSVKIKDISVGKWSGKIPGKTPSESDKENDTIKFNNDDVVSGKLKSIKDNKVTFKTEYADMSIPIERVKEIITALDSRHRARRRGNDVRLFFESGDSVTLEITKIAANEIEGETENFGKAKLSLNAFKKIQFNIYDD